VSILQQLYPLFHVNFFSSNENTFNNESAGQQREIFLKNWIFKTVNTYKRKSGSSVQSFFVSKIEETSIPLWLPDPSY